MPIPPGFLVTHQYTVHVQRLVNETDSANIIVIADVTHTERWIPLGAAQARGTDEPLVIAEAVAQAVVS